MAHAMEPTLMAGGGALSPIRSEWISSTRAARRNSRAAIQIDISNNTAAK